MNITIIGAGPIGCYCGYLLAVAGHKVNIYEEHLEIGLPIQCTGLLTSDFDEFNIPKEHFLVNTFSEIEVNSPMGNKTIIKQKEYLIDRHKFDSYLAEMARKVGVNIHLQHSLIRKEKEILVVKDIKNNQELFIQSDIVIGADGPLSKTAKLYGFYGEKRNNYYGIQAVVKGEFNPKRYNTFFGKDICPDLFAWIVPESSTIARIGLASTKNSKIFFDKFIGKYQFKVKEIQGGIIPLYSSNQKLKQNNCYLVGDASGFVKATTLGGIVPELKQVQILVDCICKNKSYEKELKSLKRKLNLHLRLRNIFNQFEDKDWDNLIKLISKPHLQQLLEKHTRENLLPILIKALVKEPRLWYFGKFLIK